jgi:hypothetical protein
MGHCPYLSTLNAGLIFKNAELTQKNVRDAGGLPVVLWDKRVKE